MFWRSSAPVRHPPGFIEPCLPTVADTVPSGPQCVHEIKHDGFRFVCRRDRDHLRIFSRRGHDWTGRVPGIARALALLPVASVTIDGEGVACGPDGVSDFERMRAAVRKGSRDAFLWPAPGFTDTEIRCHDGTGGVSWIAGDIRVSSRLKR